MFKSWNAIRHQLERRGIWSVHTKYCRAIFATYLRKCGLEQEVIDIYQGRVSASIFQKNYLKTNIKEDRERILKAIHQLLKKELLLLP
jgi:intergrase/recombinase